MVVKMAIYCTPNSSICKRYVEEQKIFRTNTRTWNGLYVLMRTNDMLNVTCTHTHTHTHTHTYTYTYTYTYIHSLAHTYTHTHSLTHSLTHSPRPPPLGSYPQSFYPSLQQQSNRPLNSPSPWYTLP
jgi:hypothetical protein